jgi:LAO/AO transport system kinase
MQDVANLIKAVSLKDPRGIARAISLVEDGSDLADQILKSLDPVLVEQAKVIGITGPPGAGKSSLTSRLISQYRQNDERVGVIAIDPTSPVSGGAILGDRIRMMSHAMDKDVVMRSMATRGRLGGLCAATGAAVRIMAGSGCSTIIIETVGVGQSEMDIVRLADLTALVVAPGLGDDIQAMKAGLLEVADLLVVNKADLPGADALALDMDTVAREKEMLPDGLSRVTLTSSIEGQGIDELTSKFNLIDQIHRTTDEHANRRKQARSLEVLDWSIEMLRPKLRSLIDQHDILQTGDPRLLAARVLADLTDKEIKG